MRHLSQFVLKTEILDWNMRYQLSFHLHGQWTLKFIDYYNSKSEWAESESIMFLFAYFTIMICFTLIFLKSNLKNCTMQVFRWTVQSLIAKPQTPLSITKEKHFTRFEQNSEWNFNFILYLTRSMFVHSLVRVLLKSVLNIFSYGATSIVRIAAMIANWSEPIFKTLHHYLTIQPFTKQIHK